MDAPVTLSAVPDVSYVRHGPRVALLVAGALPRVGPCASASWVASALMAQKIRTGDVILEISGNPVRTPEDLVNGVKDANKLQRRAVLLRVKSGNETRFVAIQLKRG